MSIGTAIACCILTAWAVTIVWIVGLVLHAGKETTNMEGDHNVKELEDSGKRTEFASGAVRDMHEGKGRFDLLPMCVLIRLAQHYEKGARKYEERNWEKGIPAHSFADSAFRHLVKYLDGYTDEDHLIAAIWNLCGLAWTEQKHPELMDIPYEGVIVAREKEKGKPLKVEAGMMKPDGLWKIYGTNTKGVLYWMPLPEAPELQKEDI